MGGKKERLACATELGKGRICIVCFSSNILLACDHVIFLASFSPRLLDASGRSMLKCPLGLNGSKEQQTF